MTKLEDGILELKKIWPDFEKVVNDALMFKQIHGDYMSKETSVIFHRLRVVLKDLGVIE